jgi:hypothetical protein
MPYIDQASRDKLDRHIDVLIESILSMENDEGNLNYSISRMLGRVLMDRGVNYRNINAMSGVLLCVQSEFYRRIATPYEESKIKNEKNGDIREYEAITQEMRALQQ